jgi:ABC-type uncharacterized transport system substrate-binding protein
MRSRIPLVIGSITLLSILMVPKLSAQTTAGLNQQAFALSKIMPSLKVVGIISSKTTEAYLQSAVRTGLVHGFKVLAAKANSPREIPELYRTLVKSGAKLIWLPDKEDVMLMEKGFEYLRESTLEDKIGLCVPLPNMVSEGALCCVLIEGDKLTVQINKKVAQVLGTVIKEDPTNSVKYVLK